MVPGGKSAVTVACGVRSARRNPYKIPTAARAAITTSKRRRFTSSLPSTINPQRSTRFQLRPRMKLSMHCLQPLLIDVRINLRRRDVGVPKHLLNDAQIGAIAQQMRREAVPEQMRITVLFQARVARVSS